MTPNRSIVRHLCTTARHAVAGTIAALGFAAAADAGACPGDGSCYEVHGTPGCASATCCTTVCQLDPFCCNSSWDALCTQEALNACGQCGDPANGSCFLADFDPGCDDAACCVTVCNADSFCCDTSWDNICASEAMVLCAQCGDAGNGGCFVTDGTPGCDDGACCAAVCAIDTFCCEVEWDTVCAPEAMALCAGCGQDGAGSCFDTHGPGCDTLTCCESVCSLDAFCCESGWDGLCVQSAFVVCGGCGTPESGSCFAPDSSPGCDNAACCATTCDYDEYCCETTWDSVCVAEAAFLCCASICPGDIDGDGEVDGSDLGLLLADYNGGGGCSDINHDGLVDGGDLGILLSAFGTCAADL